MEYKAIHVKQINLKDSKDIPLKKEEIHFNSVML